MRKYVLCIVLLAIQCCAFAQSKPISETVKNTSLHRVFRMLERKYNLKIAYDTRLAKSQKVSFSLRQKSIDESFSFILKNTNLSYSISKGNYIVVYPKKHTTQQSGGTYNGWIVDNHGGEAIAFARIKQVGENHGTYADENGKFSLKVNTGNPSFEISALGYSKQIINGAKFKQGIIGKVRLLPDIQEFPEVVVEYLAEGMTMSKDASSIMIRPKRLGSVPGTTDPDVFKTAQTVPGVSSANETASEMQIRGGTSDQNLIIWEGIPLFHSGHMSGMISLLNPQIIESAEIHRGVYAPRYGGRASGLINLKSMQKLPERLNYGGGVDMIYADAYAITPIGEKMGLMLSGRRSYVDVLRTPTYNRLADRVLQETELRQMGYLNEQQFLDSTDNESVLGNTFYFLDLNGKLLYQPTEKTQLSLSFLQTDNQLDYLAFDAVDSTESTRNFRTQNSGVSLQGDHKLTSHWSLHGTLSYTNYSYRYEDIQSYYFEEDTFKYVVNKSNRLSSLYARFRAEHQIDSVHHINMGYQLNALSVRYEFEEEEDDEFVFNETGFSSTLIHSVHSNYRFDKNKWLVKAGLRGDYLSNTGVFYLEPRMYGQYRMNDQFLGKLGVGIQNQYVSQIEDLDQDQHGLSNRVWVLADQVSVDDEQSIPAIQSQLMNAGIVYRKKGWQIELEGYIKSLIGVSLFADDKTLSSGFQRGVGAARGIDVLIRKRWKNWRSWMTYSLSRVAYQFEGLSDESFAAPFDRPHVFKWNNTLELKNFELGISFRMASGKPYTPISYIGENMDAEDIDDQFFIVYQPINSARLNPYHRLDITGMYTLKPKSEVKKWQMKFGVSMLNVYNATNFLSRTYRLEIYEDEDGEVNFNHVTIDRFYLKFTPNAVIRIQFN